VAVAAAAAALPVEADGTPVDLAGFADVASSDAGAEVVAGAPDGASDTGVGLAAKAGAVATAARPAIWGGSASTT